MNRGELLSKLILIIKRYKLKNEGVLIMNRNELLSKLRSAINHLQTVDEYNVKRNTSDIEASKLKRKMEKIQHGKQAIYIYLGIGVFGVLINMIGLIMLGTGIVMFGLFLGWIPCLILHKKVFKKKNQLAAQQFYEEQVAPAEQTARNYQTELDNMKDSPLFMEIHSLMPNYCSLDALQWIEQAVRNNRADTLKEAINLYEDALHQGRIEHLAQEQRNISAETAKATNSIKWNTQMSNLMIASELHKRKKR